MHSTFSKLIKKMKYPRGIELYSIISITLLSAFLRLYRIADYMTFLGDEGRDVIVAKGILEGNFTLLGPRASAGDFFLGPIYYYMIAPFLWLWHYSPVGPAVMVALIGIATVVLVYHVGKEFFNVKAGLMAAMLYAISPVVIAFSRSSWNPNPMPFFSLLSMYLLYHAVKRNSWKLFLTVGLLLGIMMQLHYISVFLAIIMVVFIAIGDQIVKIGLNLKRYVLNYSYFGVGFLIGFSPFLAFEARHGFPNIRTIFSFIFSANASGHYISNQTFLSVVADVFFRLFGRLVSMFPSLEFIDLSKRPDLIAIFYGTIIVSFASIVVLILRKEKLKIALFLLWLILGVGLFGFYKKLIYEYYFGFMFTLPFLLVGNFLSFLTSLKKMKLLGAVVSLSIFGFLVVYNLSGNPFRYEPNRQLNQAKTIAEFVLSKTDGKPFNFALITKSNSDYAYRYFFDAEGNKPVDLKNLRDDPERKSATGQLLVICENIGEDCHPLGHPLWEVSGFGRAEITGEWNVSVVKVYRLVHYTGN